jgi:hypothetical protein
VCSETGCFANGCASVFVVLEYCSLHCTSSYVRNVSQTINKLINAHWERLQQTIRIFFRVLM